MDNGSSISEDLFADRLRAADEAAFRYIMNRYFPIITLFALRIVGDRPTAEDIAEETFIKLWHNHAKVGNFQSVKAFLYITAKNACLNEKRSAKNLVRRLEGFAGEQPEHAGWIDREIIRAEVQMEILRAVDELPEKMRKVFQLGFLEGMPNREIARELSISVNTVKTQKARALELLKEKLRDKDVLPLVLTLFHAFQKIKS